MGGLRRGLHVVVPHRNRLPLASPSASDRAGYYRACRKRPHLFVVRRRRLPAPAPSPAPPSPLPQPPAAPRPPALPTPPPSPESPLELAPPSPHAATRHIPTMLRYRIFMATHYRSAARSSTAHDGWTGARSSL